MKVKSISSKLVHFMETDEDEYFNYIRYGKDAWFNTMGESDEPVYDCEWLEELFQENRSKYENR